MDTHHLESFDRQRAKAKANERAILELEAATVLPADEVSRHIAVLNKITAAGILAVPEHQIAESRDAGTPLRPDTQKLQAP